MQPGDRWPRGLLLGALLAMTFLWSVDFGATTIALPEIDDELKLGFGLLEWLVTINFAVFGLVMVLAGRVSDTWPRAAFLIGIGLYAVSAIMSALAPSAIPLIVARAGLGLGAGFITPLTIVAIRQLTQSRRLGLWLGIFSAVIALGDVLGAIIGGVILDTLGWRWMFGLAAPIALLLLAVGWPGLRLLRSVRATTRIPLLGTLVLLVAITLILIAVNRGPAWGWIPVALALLTVGSLLLWAFIRFDSRSATPLFEPGLFGTRAFIGAVVLRAMSYATLVGTVVLTTGFLQNVEAYDAHHVGLLLMPLFITETISAVVGGRLADAVGPRLPVVAAIVIGAAGLVLCATAEPGAPLVTGLLPGFVLYGIGLGFLVPPIEAAGLRAVGPEYAGTAGGVLRTAAYVGLALGAVLMALTFSVITGGRFDGELRRVGLTYSEDERRELHELIGTRGVDDRLDRMDLATATSLDAAVRDTFMVGYRWTLLGTAAVALLAVPIALVLLGGPSRAPPQRLRAAFSSRPVIAGGVLAAALAGLGASLAAVFGVFDAPPEAQGSTVRGNQLVVYSSLPLRGPDAVAGRDLVAGQRLALRDHGGRAGRFRIRFQALNDAAPGTGWSAELVRRNARRAADDPRTIAYVGEFNSGASAVAMPILNRAGILQVSPLSTAISLTRNDPAAPAQPEDYRPTGQRTFARVIQNDQAQAAALLLLLRQRGIDDLYLVHDGDIYGEGLADEIERVASRRGIDIVGTAEFRPNQLDEQAASVAAADAEAMLFTGASTPGLAPFFDAVHLADPDLLLLGPDGLTAQSFIRAIGPAAASRTIVTFPARKPGTYPPAGERFLRRFQAIHGRRPAPDAIYGYEAMSAILDSIEAAGEHGNSRAAVVDRFFAIEDRDSVLGNYSIDSYGDTTLPYYGAYRIVDGELVYDD